MITPFHRNADHTVTFGHSIGSRVSCEDCTKVANLSVKKYSIGNEDQLLALTLNLRKFIAVHGLWTSALGLSQIHTGVGARFYANCNKARNFCNVANWWLSGTNKFDHNLSINVNTHLL